MTTVTIRPLADEDIPRNVRHIVRHLEAALGFGPSFLRTAAHSPSAVEAFSVLSHAANRTGLTPRLRQAVALRVAQLNRCAYALSAETLRAREAGWSESRILCYRRGISDNPREQALLSLATKIVEDRGHHARLAVDIARRNGATDADILAIVQLVTLGIFCTYLTNLAGTPLDGPPVDAALPPACDKDPQEERREG